MRWPEIAAMWLREGAQKMREKADAIEDAYKSQVARAYYEAAFDFEQLAEKLEKQ